MHEHEHETALTYRVLECQHQSTSASGAKSSSNNNGQKQKKEKPKTSKAMKTGNSSKARTLPELFDFDCNLTHDDLFADVASHVASARAANITRMLVPGSTLEESRKTITLCKNYPEMMFPTAGVHPYHAAEQRISSELLEELRTLVSTPSVVAVGECGLDYSEGFPSPDIQKEWFIPQLELSCLVQKPLFLHERLAHEDFIAAIEQCKKRNNRPFPPAVVHCFTGTRKELETYLDMGFYIGLTGFLCKKKHGEALREIVHLIPSDRLVIETDAPYLGFPKCRAGLDKNAKKQYPNVPTALLMILEEVAKLRNEPIEDLARATTANARRFLRILK